MSFTRWISRLTLVAAAATSACSGNSDRKTDSALQTDLSLAQQQQQAHVDSLNAAEINGTGVGNATALRAPTATPTTTRRTSSTTTRRTASRRSGSSSGSSSGSVGTSSGTVTTSSGGEVVVKHTQRDAAIGAAAGAVIGATTSRDKVKGGVIGAVVGGVLGGVIGNNVEKRKKKPPM